MIDYRKIADAVDYYVEQGYKYIEVPWIAKKETVDITRPDWCREFDTFLGCLVSSGEQSFLEIRDKLEDNKKYVCVTPCFRDESVINQLTQNWFLKAELIIVNPTSIDMKLTGMKLIARNFFEKYSHNSYVEITNEGFDILINGIEVGSYGYREYKDFGWIYGTGCAEPRLSQALRS